MVRQVELPDPLVEAVVDEAVEEVQEEVAVHRPEDLLDAHPIVEDAVEHGFTDLVVVQGAGFHAWGSGAEGRATVATGPVFAIGDVEIDDLLVGDNTDLTVKNILALTQLATSGAWGLARGAFQGYGANVGILHLHGLRVRGTWLGNHISRHADLNFRCQEQLWNNITLSASARSLDHLAIQVGGNVIRKDQILDLLEPIPGVEELRVRGAEVLIHQPQLLEQDAGFIRTEAAAVETDVDQSSS